MRKINATIITNMIRHFRDLEVYRKSQELYPQMIKFTRDFPYDGKHLKDQACRSANAVHADIAEGFGRSVADLKCILQEHWVHVMKQKAILRMHLMLNLEMRNSE